MFNEATGYIKAHPYQVGILALMAGTALYLVAGSGGASGSTVVAGSGAPSESFQLQAMTLGNQLQVAAMQATTAANNVHGQVEIEGIKSDTQKTLAQYSTDAAVAIQSLLSGVAIKNIDAQQAVQLANISETGATQRDYIGAQVSTAQIGASTMWHLIDALAPHPAIVASSGGGSDGGGSVGNGGVGTKGICPPGYYWDGLSCVPPVGGGASDPTRDPPVLGVVRPGGGGGSGTGGTGGTGGGGGSGETPIVCGPGFFVDAFGHCSDVQNSWGGMGGRDAGGPAGYSHDSVSL